MPVQTRASADAQNHPRMSDDAFIQALETCQLNPAHFDHRGHLRYAWLMTSRHPLAQAASRVSCTIHRFANFHGAKQKYHHSLTLACVALIAQRPACMHFDQFLEQHPDLANDLTTVLAQYYHPHTLASDEARHSWCAPDRKALAGAEILAQVPVPGHTDHNIHH